MRYLLLLGLLVAGCKNADDGSSGGNLTIGQVCDSSDQCEDGLDCLAQPGDDPWCDQDSYCTIDCVDDDQCVEELGDGHICVEDCGATLCFEGSRG